MQIDEHLNEEYLINFFKFQIELGIRFSSFKNSLKENNFFNLIENANTVDELENVIRENTNSEIKLLSSGSFDFKSKTMIIVDELTAEEILQKRLFSEENKILLENILNSIGLLMKDVFVINLGVKKDSDYLILLHNIFKKYFQILKPSFLISMCSNAHFNTLFQNLEKNFNYFMININHPSKLNAEPRLKRNAWESLKSLKLKLDRSNI